MPSKVEPSDTPERNRRLPLHPVLLASGVVATFAWLYFVFSQKIAGPLSPDELFFIHIFWMQGQGLTPYVDFNSQHLPTYFALLQPILPTNGTSLGFAYILRAISAVVLVCYLLFLLDVSRTLARLVPAYSVAPVFFSLAPVLLLFVNNTRLAEIRPDSFAMLLESLAWWLLIRAELAAERERSAAWVSVISGCAAALAGLFAVRSLVILTVFAPTYLALAVTSRSTLRKRFVIVAVVAGLFAAGSAYVLLRETVDRAVWHALIVPGGAQGFPFVDRFFALLTLPILVILVIAFAAALFGVARGPREWRRALIAASASIAAGLLLIIVDPAPFEYSFGHAVVAVSFVLGLLPALVKSKHRVATASNAGVGVYGVLGLAAITLLFAGYLAFPRLKHRPPPQFLDFAIHQAPSRRELASATLPQLLDQLVRTEAATSLTEQLRVREAVCRRLKGPVLATFYTHPVCVRDASFYWFHASWPSVYAEQLNFQNKRIVGLSQGDLARMFRKRRPVLFMWTTLTRDGTEARPLAPWLIPIVDRAYERHAGYALLRNR